MKDDKDFDCVQMKYDIQRRLLEKWRGQSDEEIHRQFQTWVETSDDDLANWWRRVCSQRTKQAGHDANAAP